VFEDVPQYVLQKDALPCDILEILAVRTDIFPSKGECRKTIQGNGLSINKEKVTDTALQLTVDHLLDSKYILVQKGKKSYYILKFE
jgi:tyrosyl-tRNA synthetase